MSNAALPPLLAPDDPPVFEALHPQATPPLILLCDHASAAIPHALGDLGLDPVDRHRHIAWDIGAAAITRLLADRFGARAVLAGYSRLVVDCNRPPGDPTAVPPVSDGSPVPGNRDLTEAQVDQRMEEIFWPYHRAVADAIAHLWRLGTPPLVVSIHSCCPEMNGFHRPWHIGLMYNHDPRPTRAMLSALTRRDPTAVLGENQPYSGKDIGFTINTHAEPAGLPNLGVEFRQDLVADAAGVARWGGLFGDALEEVMADPTLFTQRMA